MKASPHSKGFTLIELVIVLTVLAIILAVAIPTYQSQMRKARRSEAIDALIRAQLAQEKHRANNTTYASALSALDGYTSDNPTTSGGYYKIGVTGTSTASTFTIEAVPQGDQADDDCGTFAIDQDGPDTGGSYADSDCWGR